MVTKLGVFFYGVVKYMAHQTNNWNCKATCKTSVIYLDILTLISLVANYVTLREPVDLIMRKMNNDNHEGTVCLYHSVSLI